MNNVNSHIHAINALERHYCSKAIEEQKTGILLHWDLLSGVDYETSPHLQFESVRVALHHRDMVVTLSQEE